MALAIPGDLANTALSRAQFRRRIFFALAATAISCLLMFVSSRWNEEIPPLARAIEGLGLALIAVSIAGRTWCTLYIGGRKKVDLIEDGPYSLVRHPLYAFSIIGAAGIGALWGSIIVSLLLALVTAAILLPMARREEQFMIASFGARYTTYAAPRRRFFPNFATWSDREVLPVRPATVARTFLQSSLFLLGIPIAEFTQWAHASHILPVLALLP